jgi:hypothetical protein
MRMSPVFSVLIDESTDITTVEQMLVYIKYMDKNGNTNVSFLETEEVSGCDHNWYRHHHDETDS